MQHEPPRSIRQDHVGVRTVVSAEGEAAGRGVRGFRRPDLARIDLDVARFTETSLGQNRQHRDGPAEVVRNQ